MPSPTQQRRLEEKEARRDQILDAAEHVLAAKGFDRTVLADVADRARLSRGLLYTYFRDKVDLYHAVGVRARDELRGQFEAAAAGRDRGVDQVHAIGRAYVRFSQERPVLFEALARSEASDVDDDARPYELADIQASRRVLGVLADAIERGVADGSVRPDVGDPHETALALWGVVHGVVQVTQHQEPVLGPLGTTGPAVHDHAFRLVDRAIAAVAP